MYWCHPKHICYLSTKKHRIKMFFIAEIILRSTAFILFSYNPLWRHAASFSSVLWRTWGNSQRRQRYLRCAWVIVPLQAAFSFCIRCEAQEGLEGSKKWDTAMPAAPHLTSNHLLSSPSACMHSFTVHSPKSTTLAALLNVLFSESTLLAMCKQMGWGTRRGTGKGQGLSFSSLQCYVDEVNNPVYTTPRLQERRGLSATYVLFFRTSKTLMCWSFCFRRQEADT